MDEQSLLEALRAMQYGTGGGMGQMNQTQRPTNDPRIGALNQYMQMQGGGNVGVPSELPQQMMGRSGAVRPQSGMETEGQIRDMYDSSREGQENLSRSTYGRTPMPPNPNTAFPDRTTEQELEDVHSQMDQDAGDEAITFEGTDAPTENDIRKLIEQGDQGPGNSQLTNAFIAQFGEDAYDRAMQ